MPRALFVSNLARMATLPGPQGSLACLTLRTSAETDAGPAAARAHTDAVARAAKELTGGLDCRLAVFLAGNHAQLNSIRFLEGRVQNCRKHNGHN